MTKDDGEIVSSVDGLCVRLGEVQNAFDNRTIEKAVDILQNDKLKYLTIRGKEGRAAVMGSNNNAYSVEFTYENGEIKNMFCDCFVSNECKHEAAVAIFLDVVIPKIEERFMSEYEKNGCITAFNLSDFWSIIFDSNSSVIV